MSYTVVRGETVPVAFFTTPAELLHAAAFDTANFAPPRADADSKVSQPTVTVADFERLVDGGGKVFGLLDPEAPQAERKIMSLGVVALRADGEAAELMLRNLGRRMSYFQGLSTDPRYRGRGLGQAAIRCGKQLSLDAGKRQMVTTVHPTNSPSLRIFFKENFVATTLIDNYYAMQGGSGARFVLVHGKLRDEDWARRKASKRSAHILVPRTPWTDEAVTADDRLAFRLLDSPSYVICTTPYISGGGTEAAFSGAFLDNFHLKRQVLSALLFPHRTLRDACLPHELHAQQYPGYRFADYALSVLDMVSDNDPLKWPERSVPTMQVYAHFSEWFRQYHQVASGLSAELPQLIGVTRWPQELESLQRLFLYCEQTLLMQACQRFGLQDVPSCDTSPPLTTEGLDIRAFQAQNIALYDQLASVDQSSLREYMDQAYPPLAASPRVPDWLLRPAALGVQLVRRLRRMSA